MGLLSCCIRKRKLQKKRKPVRDMANKVAQMSPRIGGGMVAS